MPHLTHGSNQQRYRKYSRRVSNAYKTRNPKLEWLLTLKYRYWRKLYGKQLNLWEMTDS